MFKNILNLKKLFLFISILILTVASTPFFFSPGLEYVSSVDPYLNGKFPKQLSSNWKWTTVDNLDVTGRIITTQYIPGTNTLAMASTDGTIYFYDFETGQISSTIWDLDTKGLFISSDTRIGLKGMAFHPKYADLNSEEGGYIFISSFTNESKTKVSRYTVDRATGLVDESSESLMIELIVPGVTFHTVGELVFGADDFLYIPLGDGKSQYNFVQHIDDNLLGGIMRIDVDKDENKSHAPRRVLPQAFEDETSGVGYYIPNDNPWLSEAGDIMEEYYSIGHRNPWKLSKDPLNGNIWGGEVGPWSGEEVNLIRKGHNYGWPYFAGDVTEEIVWFNNIKPDFDPAPEEFRGVLTEAVFSPIRSEARSIYVGDVYRGTKWPEFYGKLLAGDTTQKSVWAVGYDETTKKVTVEVLPNLTGYYELFESQDGEIMALSFNGTLTKLERDTANTNDDFPELLSETGAFTSLNPLTGSTSLIPYTVNTPLWSDRADKQRWIVLPNNGVFNTSKEQITFKSDAPWEFPAGTVFIKHFALALNEQNPDVLKPLETRFMIVGENGGTYGVTYKWLEDGSDALLTIEGAIEDFTIMGSNGANYTQTWEYPSSNECINCHNANAGQSLGINTQQLNGDYKYPLSGITDNQLNTLNELNVFSADIGEASQYIHNVALDDPTASNELKVRSYLDANCAYCHMPGGVDAAFDARITTPLLNQGLINELVASAGSENDMVIVPGDLATSELYLRDNSTGAIAMPPLGRTMVDQDYIKVLEAWVYGLAGVTEENIALNKPTQQSTTAFDGQSSRAVDGNTSGNYSQNSTTHTAKRKSSWWRVDLGGNYALSAIKVFNRTNCCIERLELAKVYVSNINSFDPKDYKEIGVLNSNSEQNFYNLEETGRYLMIYQERKEFLSLAEVEAYGTLIPSTEDNVIGEVGLVSINTDYTTVTFENTYANPVVIAGGASYNGGQPVTVRIDELKTTSFNIRLDEWDCYDGTHYYESVSYMVVEAGTYSMPNGKLLQAGNFEANSGTSFSSINYPSAFDEEPIAFAQAVSEREEETINMRIQHSTSDKNTLSVLMQEKDRDNSGHTGELISWIAIESGSGTNDESIFEVGSTPNVVTEQWYTINLKENFTTTPIFISKIGSYVGSDASSLRYRNLTTNSVQVFVQEEECGDIETNHGGAENVNYAIFDKAGAIFGERIEIRLVSNFNALSLPFVEGIDDLIIYPNPIASGSAVSFQWNSIDTNAAELKVTDLQGNLQDNISINTKIGTNVYRYNSTNLSQGVYIISLSRQGKETISKQLLVN